MTLSKQSRIRHISTVWYVPTNPHQAGILQHYKELYWQTQPNLKSVWKRIRKRWMKEQEVIHGKGNLTCSICGKTKLNPWSKIREELATCDHIRPFSSAPHLWDEPSNFQVACYRCNSSKENIH